MYKLTRAAVEGSPAVAYRHARSIIRAERAVHIYREQWLQSRLLAHPFFLQAADLYYGTVHFVAPVVVLVLLARRDPARYRSARTVLVLATGLALVGFAWYPLTPPRLLPAAYHFVDTVARFGGEGVLNSGSMKDADNVYAAMPSLHIAWSLWCLFSVWPVVRSTAARVLAVAYPIVTLVAVVITANHYILDGVGGVITLAAAYVAASTLAQLVSRSSHSRLEAL